MKLLSRQAVNSQIAEQRRQEISEGKELVERVSALRKALADLNARKGKDFNLVLGTSSTMNALGMCVFYGI